MSSKTISQLYLEHEKSFIKHLKSAKDLDEEEIHRLRVDIKQLRSLFRLLRQLAGKKSKTKKALKLVDPVFKSAGKIRNTSQNIKLSRQFKEPVMRDLRNHLVKRGEKLGKDLKEELGEFAKNKFKNFNSKIALDFKKLEKDHVQQRSQKYVKEIFEEVKHFIPNIENDDTFHEIRKKLKDIKTIDQLLSELSPHKKNGKIFEKVKSIEHRIGSWHDRIMLLEAIEKYLKHRKKGEKKQFGEVMMAIRKQNEKSKEAIAGQLAKLQSSWSSTKTN